MARILSVSNIVTMGWICIKLILILVYVYLSTLISDGYLSDHKGFNHQIKHNKYRTNIGEFEGGWKENKVMGVPICYKNNNMNI